MVSVECILVDIYLVVKNGINHRKPVSIIVSLYCPRKRHTTAVFGQMTRKPRNKNRIKINKNIPIKNDSDINAANVINTTIIISKAIVYPENEYVFFIKNN